MEQERLRGMRAVILAVVVLLVIWTGVDMYRHRDEIPPLRDGWVHVDYGRR